MRPYPGVFLVLLVLASATSVPAKNNVPWDRITDARGLTSPQRKVVETVLRTALCYGGCEGSVLDCVRSGDAIGVRIANFAARRAAENKDANAILTSVEKRREAATAPDTLKIDLSSLLPCGNASAPVQVVIYADFDCPYCREAATALRELCLATPDRFSLWFKNYPLAQDDRALPAALAYLAAERQGRGWEMFDGLFSHTVALTDDELEHIADASGVDLVQYRSDLRDPKLKTRVRREKIEATACGFHKVPGILVNGKPYHGILSKAELLDRIDEETEMVSRRGQPASH